MIAGSVAQASFDAYMLPRHIGLYAGAPIEAPAHLVQRVCGTGIEALMQGADAVAHRGVGAALCVCAESMSRNPVAAYTHRNGFRMGQVEFKDFLWEALLDPAPGVTMGGTAENLARQYQITRAEVDAFAARSFERALAAQANGFLDGEIVAVSSEKFECDGYQPRGIRLDRKVEAVRADTHPRPSPMAALAKLPAVFGGVQTGGQQFGRGGRGGRRHRLLGRLRRRRRARSRWRAWSPASPSAVRPRSWASARCRRFAPCWRNAGWRSTTIDRIEINEAFAAQVMACARELGLDEEKLNVNGGAIAIGHPLAATGIRLAVTLARELRRAGLRRGIASACIGGGQGIALLIENPDYGA